MTPPLRPPAAHSPWILGFIVGTLVVAVAAMGALHLVQSELDPIAEPVSFYVHGKQGWLLPTALVAFGLAGIALAWAVPAPGWGRRALVSFSLGLIVAGAIPSDQWFPWEKDPTAAGLVHSALGLVAPALLLIPMIAWSRRPCATSPATGSLVLAVAYAGALLVCSGCLVIGFAGDRSPPYIGLAERYLACVAVAWFGVTTWRIRSRRA